MILTQSTTEILFCTATFRFTKPEEEKPDLVSSFYNDKREEGREGGERKRGREGQGEREKEKEKEREIGTHRRATFLYSIESH